MASFVFAFASPRGASASGARAQKAAAGDPPNVAAAKKHAERAHELYAGGSYREAIGELETALTLDPSGKELVYNLGVVHEKLGDVDDALKYFRQYATMDLTPDERERTEGAIRRLEGAKREIEAKQEAERNKQLEEQQRNAPKEAAPAPPPEPPARGRIDAATIAVGVTSVVGFAIGVGFGVKALSDKPAANSFVTGQDGSYADFQSKASSAHHEAIVSDIGFGVGVAGAVTTALLFALRPKARAGDQPPATGADTTVAAAPLRGGGAVVLHGAW